MTTVSRNVDYHPTPSVALLNARAHSRSGALVLMCGQSAVFNLG
jgi:hypothetical protein